MAKSVRVGTIGKKQVYNLLDPKEMLYALKAINERATQIGKTWGFDSTLYKSYVSPMVNAQVSQYVRIDKHGHIKFKTGKIENVTDIQRDLVKKMLSKQSKGEIIEHTRQNLSWLDVNLKTPDVIDLAPHLRDFEEEVYDLLHEMYDADKRDQRGMKNTKWYKDFLSGHGNPSTESLQSARDYLKKKLEEIRRKNNNADIPVSTKRTTNKSRATNKKR